MVEQPTKTSDVRAWLAWAEDWIDSLPGLIGRWPGLDYADRLEADNEWSGQVLGIVNRLRERGDACLLMPAESERLDHIEAALRKHRPALIQMGLDDRREAP